MKIGYFADGPWSHLALERITQDKNFEVVFVVPRYSSQDPVLREWSERLQVDFLPVENINLYENVKKLTQYDADIFVSMSFNQIFKKEILGAVPSGIINCHAGALPYYRGRNILNWVLINDEKEFGVTVHYVDEGIDTGDIILQQKSEITDEDDYGTLLKRATVLCADLLFKALVEIQTGNVRRKPQDEIDSVGFYCGKRCLGDEWINWGWSSRRIFNFVRAITIPGPCARTTLDGKEIILKNAQLIPGSIDYIGISGEVVGIKREGIVVKTGDSSILLRDVELPNTIKKLRVGHRFGLNLNDAFHILQSRIRELESKSVKGDGYL